MELTTTLNRISNGVYSIDQGMVRCFLILGTERALLLDTGAGECDLPGLIRTVTDLPLIVVQTHGDGDHTANSGSFPDYMTDMIYLAEGTGKLEDTLLSLSRFYERRLRMKADVRGAVTAALLIA